MPRECAQATVEFVGTLPLLAFGAAICVQALLVGCAAVFVQTAADRAAHGVPRAQVARSVPAGWRDGISITREGADVTVRLRAPAVLPGVGSRLAVEATSREVES